MQIQSQFTTECSISSPVAASLADVNGQSNSAGERIEPGLQLKIELDRQCDLPLYIQLFEAIAWHIESGDLAPNSKLPSVRRFATEIGISTETVCKAMDLLLSNGFIETGCRRNAVVSTMWSGREAYVLPDHLRLSVIQPTR
jgi:hypothetical protein